MSWLVNHPNPKKLKNKIKTRNGLRNNTMDQTIIENTVDEMIRLTRVITEEWEKVNIQLMFFRSAQLDTLKTMISDIQDKTEKLSTKITEIEKND